MQDHSQPDTQRLSFDYAPAWMGALKKMSLAAAAFRFTAAPGVSWPAGTFVIGTLKVGSQKPVDISVDDTGLGSLSAPAWTLAQMSGSWSMTLDLKAIRTNAPALLKDGQWIDPDKLLDIEMMLGCAVTLY
jgi:hypothetical protein